MIFNSCIIEKANQIVNSAEDAYIGLIDLEGFPTVSTISSIQTEGIYKLYFSTGTEGDKVRRIGANPRASVCYRRGGDNVTLVGTIKVLTDPEIKHTLWQDWFIDHFPGGKDDPTYCILEFVPHRASLWIDCENAQFTIGEISTVQSSCGLLCSHCSFKEPCGCGGCIETKGHPFHGECPVATCCRGKGYTHCGQCPDMPCQQLREYSCGESEHCDRPAGARLEILKRWAKAE